MHRQPDAAPTKRFRSPAELKRDATSQWLLSLARPTPAKAREHVRALKVFLNLGGERRQQRPESSQASRIRVFCLIYAAYVGLLIARKNYGFWIPHAMQVLDRSKSEVAVIGSSYEMASGAGALLNGFIIDVVDPSLALACALAASALVNLGLSGARSLPLMAALWGCNGVVQSLGWPCVSKVFLRAFPDPKGRGMWYSILSTSQNVGAALVPVVVAQAVAWAGDKRVAFYVPAACALSLSAVLLKMLWGHCEPQTTTAAAAAAAAARAREAAAAAAASKSRKKSEVMAAARAERMRALVHDVVLNWRLWLMGVNYFCIGVIRSSLTDWTPIYLSEHKQQPVAVASTCLFAFELGGFLGSMAAGRASDSLFHGRRGPVMALCTGTLCPALLLLDATTDARALPLVYFVLGALCFPVHVLLGLASREVVSPQASSTAGGLVKFVAQLGASSAGYPLGLLQQRQGWKAVFGLLSSVALTGGLFTLPLWRTVARVDERAIERKHKQKGG